MKKTPFLIIVLCIISVFANAQNTNLGTNAGNAGLENTAIGFEAGDVIVGSSGTFVGHQSGKNVTSGSSNSFVGAFSGYSTTIGKENSFFGYAAGYLNSTGKSNSFIGVNSGYFNSGNFNSFVGAFSGYRNTSGSDNAFTGYASGLMNTTGSENAFFGSRSGENNITGEENTYFGYGAGRAGTTSSYNCFFGHEAGESISSGSDNTFMGYGAGKQTTTGEFNVYVGWLTGLSNQTGIRNVYLGSAAGISSTGSRNVFIGYLAGANETGSDKLVVENGLGPSTPPLIYGNFDSGQLGIATNSLGSFALSVNGDAFATGMWVSSDRRFKTKEKTIASALQKLNDVNGVSYQFKKGEEARSRNFAEGEQLGFIAQDLKKTFPELVREDGAGYLAVNYQGMIPVLVEAIKELSAEVEHLRTQLENTKSDNISGQIKTKGTSLRQNYPNPSNQVTTIEYALADNVTDAALYVFDLNGKQVAVYNHLNAGTGKVTISASQLPAGLYHYSLVTDGTIVDTKKMLLTN